MNTLLLLFVLAAPPDSLAAPFATDPPAGQEAASDGLKRFHEYEREARDAMRREATAKTQADRAAAIRDLAALYEELKADSRLATSEALTGLKGRLWSRLTSVKKDIQRDLARQAAQAKRAAGRAGERAGGRAGAPLDEAESAAEALAAELSLAAFSLGGPSAIASQSGAFGGGGVFGDYGQTLVDLIERVIAPDKWDTVGGPFSIVYYAPLRVLVVSATQEVHGSVSGLFNALRQAGN